MQEMISWPVEGAHYHDSGEGGMFAWMVVPEAVSSGEAFGSNAYGTNCHVDVGGYLSRPRSFLDRPDACVSTEAAAKLYEWRDYRKSWVQQSMEIGKILEQHTQGTALSRAALYRTLGADDISVPLLASTFLGSTCLSLWNEDVGRYFEAGRGDLTAQGRRLYDIQSEVYGVGPVILTFLDT